MLLRKRAWDVMRSDLMTIGEEASMTEAIKALNEALRRSPDNDCVMVVNRKGRFKGLLTTRSVLRALGPCLLKELRERKGEDWEGSFEHAVSACSQARVSDYEDKGVPMVNPGETLGRVLEILNDYRTDRVAVEEGDKVIGIILHTDVYMELCREIEVV